MTDCNNCIAVAFMQVFDWQLWVVLFAASAVLCPFIYFSEIDFQNRGLGKARFPSALGSGEAVFKKKTIHIAFAGL
jgi:hypothetical protein